MLTVTSACPLAFNPARPQPRSARNGSWRHPPDLPKKMACDEDLHRILNESLSGSAHGSVGSVGSGDNDEVARPRAIPFMLVSGSSVPRFLR
jgi:hypothetical protein